MTAAVAVCVLGVVCVALLAVLFLRERQHDAERAGLLDRIQSPEAAHARALAAAAGGSPAPPVDLDAEDDAKHGRALVFDDDLSVDDYLTEGEVF